MDMDRQMEALRGWGCDVDGAMDRMANDREFYIECLTETAGDVYFSELKSALDTEDMRKAFDASHTLKGVLANVGLTPMFDKLTEIVEPLRAGHSEGLAEKYEQLEQQRARLMHILQEE